MDPASQTTTPREPKRVPMACTTCRHKKLKCRPLPASSDNAQRRCQRCAEANLQCVFVPVSSEQPISASSTPQHYQFRVDSAPYDPSYGSYEAWQEQPEVYLKDPASAMSNASELDSGAPPPHQGYASLPLQPSSGFPPAYQIPSGWPAAYSMQPQGMNSPPGDMSNHAANPMQYHMLPGGPSGWQGNASQHQVYPPYDMNSFQGHPGSGRPDGSAWR